MARAALRIGLCLAIPLLVSGCAWINERTGGATATSEATQPRTMARAGNGAVKKHRGDDRRGEPRGGVSAIGVSGEHGETETVGLAEPATVAVRPTAAATAVPGDDIGPANVTASRQAGGGMVAAWVGADATASSEALGIESLTAAPRSAAQGEAAARAQITARFELVRRLLRQGKVLQARGTLESIIELSPASALHELARTYDPYYLGQLPKLDDGSEPRKAAELYLEAIGQGSASAGGDLDRLRSSYPALR